MSAGKAPEAQPQAPPRAASSLAEIGIGDFYIKFYMFGPIFCLKVYFLQFLYFYLLDRPFQLFFKKCIFLWISCAATVDALGAHTPTVGALIR